MARSGARHGRCSRKNSKLDESRGKPLEVFVWEVIKLAARHPPWEFPNVWQLKDLQVRFLYVWQGKDFANFKGKIEAGASPAGSCRAVDT